MAPMWIRMRQKQASRPRRQNSLFNHLKIPTHRPSRMAENGRQVIWTSSSDRKPTRRTKRRTNRLQQTAAEFAMSTYTYKWMQSPRRIYSRTIKLAMPIPVPMHMLITPSCWPCLSISGSRPASCLAPVAPRGCPSYRYCVSRLNRAVGLQVREQTYRDGTTLGVHLALVNPQLAHTQYTA
jgi:hypothetical protein